MINEMLEILKVGGFSAYAILLASICMWYFFVDSYLRLWVEKKVFKTFEKGGSLESHFAFRFSLFAASFIQFKKQLSNGEGKKAYEQISKDLDVILPIFERKLVFAASVVQLAPLLGLLGTVSGMILTFTHIRDVSSSNQQLAEGISKALYTTEFGLVVAIPGVYLGLYLKRNVSRFYYRLQDWMRLSRAEVGL